jgi:hypothetical protein
MFIAHRRADGRVAVVTASQVTVLQYPGEESDVFVRWEIPAQSTRKSVHCGTLNAEVRVR